jgi:hypothetical protein
LFASQQSEIFKECYQARNIASVDPGLLRDRRHAWECPPVLVGVAGYGY